MLNNEVAVLRNIIRSQKDTVSYRSSECTKLHKSLVYTAFDHLLQQFPDEMSDYLLRSIRGGFQHRIFQEYITLLEAAIPYSFKKNNKVYRIESLLDDGLTLFNGISTFTGVVLLDGTIKNDTQEFYIGGRKATIAKPYYIGKLLGLLDAKTKQSLMPQVEEYTFSYIKTKNISPATTVIATHLRVPPHYQMGGMTYINRVRKAIIEELITPQAY